MAPNMTHLQEPDPAQRPARLALYVGVGLVGLGALAMYLGYNGAATNPIPQAQTPYVISGGLLGVALMVLGAVVIAMHVLLQVTGDFRRDLGAMRDAIEQLGDVMARSGTAGAVTLEGHASSNGTVMIARGATSFHRAECRLVDRADHVRPASREDAESQGLTPCRVCNP